MHIGNKIMTIKSITIKRFKNLEDLKLNLGRINVLVGSNNSGKSSILQGIQFAVSIAQTAKLSKATWKDSRISTSISPIQLIYTPLKDVSALAPFGNLKEDKKKAIYVNFEEEENNLTTEITVKKGRNKNIVTELVGKELGEKLQSLENPFSMYVPGLAGIQNVEEYKSPGIVRKAAARGAANNVFRNILWILKQGDGWDQFVTDFQYVFPNLNVNIHYDPELDDHISVNLDIEGRELPIDAAGTGVLQTIQILSYVNVYKPRLLLLDEPDSHLHPNNQRSLIKMLNNLAEKRELQIILCTHSRHIIDELSQNSTINWIRDGKLVNEVNPDIVNVLIDLGALDVGDLLQHGTIKCVILTEDAKTDLLLKLCEAADFKIDEIEIWSYKGCTKLDVALTLAAFIKKHAQASKIIVHRDRDYSTDDEIAQFKADIEKAGLLCFITKGTDIESHFLNPEHINQLNPSMSIEKIRELITISTNEVKENSLAKFINSRFEIERRKSNADSNIPKKAPGDISIQANKDYDANPEKYRHGKTVVKKLKQKFREETGENIIIYETSAEIIDQQLEEFKTEIWRV